MKKEVTGRAKGGVKTSELMTPDQKAKRAKNGAIARWGAKATHKGNFKAEFGIDVECYVLDDPAKTAVISQRGMGVALGYSEGGSRFSNLIKSKTLSDYLGHELTQKIENPLIFQSVQAGTNSSARTHGYDVSILIDVCKAIVQAETDGKLKINQENLAKQAHLILGASAKAGIKGLVYALAGYRPEVEEVIAAFKSFVQEEAKKYEREFPVELYYEWARLYGHNPIRSWKNMHLTIDHIYYPLAKSNGKLLGLLRDAKSSAGNRNAKLFQFLNEVGARALRFQLGRVYDVAQNATDQAVYESEIEKRFGNIQKND